MRKIILLLLMMSIIGLGKGVIDLINEGIIYLKAGDYVKAIEKLEEAKQKSPQNSDIYYYIGEAYFRSGNLDEAISNYQKAIEISPEKPSYYYSLAMVYLSQNKKKEAMELFDKIIQLSPLSIYGKEAAKLKKELEYKETQAALLKKWEKAATMEELKLEGGTKEQKPPIQSVIRKIKFGTKDERITASALLPSYSSTQILEVIDEVLLAIKNETSWPSGKVKRNLIMAAGKVNTPEVITTLLEVLQSDDDSRTRIVTLDALRNFRTEEVISKLRDALSSVPYPAQKRQDPGIEFLRYPVIGIFFKPDSSPEQPDFILKLIPPQKDPGEEERNRIIFATKLIYILGNMKDKESLSDIESGWSKVDLPALRIYYNIARGKLGDFSSRDEMIQRLMDTFPTENVEEEINIRKNILEVMEDYLRENKEEADENVKKIKGLIEYIAGDSRYPELQKKARAVISSLGIATATQ